MGFSKSELSILFTNNDEIAELNRKYRGVNGPTDVLSFPMHDDPLEPSNEPYLLGDIVISVPMAKDIAEQYSTNLESVVDVLLCHGILHLIGYDHDNSEKAADMDQQTMRLLKLLGYQKNDIDWYLTSKWYSEE